MLRDEARVERFRNPDSAGQNNPPTENRYSTHVLANVIRILETSKPSAISNLSDVFEAFQNVFQMYHNHNRIVSNV